MLKIQVIHTTDNKWFVMLTDATEDVVMEMECVSERDAYVTASLLKGKTLR